MPSPGGGHDAMSCDLLPTRSPGPHYQGDIRDVLDYPWDLMVAHPPCTHLSVSGAKHFAGKQMLGLQQAAVSFFMLLAKADIPRIAIENPVCIMSSLWRRPDQIIQPWQFGHGETKATCLWLKGLPLLQPTNIVEAAPTASTRCRQGRTVHGIAARPTSASRKLSPSNGAQSTSSVQREPLGATGGAVMDKHDLFLIVFLVIVMTPVSVLLHRYARGQVREAKRLEALGWRCVGNSWLLGPIMAPPRHLDRRKMSL